MRHHARAKILIDQWPCSFVLNMTNSLGCHYVDEEAGLIYSGYAGFLYEEFLYVQCSCFE